MEGDLLGSQPKNRIIFPSTEMNLLKNFNSKHPNNMEDMDIHQVISIVNQLMNII